MVLRHLDDGVLIANVAAEFRVSRPTVATWVASYLDSGETGLVNRCSAPHNNGTRIPATVLELIDFLRRGRKWPARRIHRYLLGLGANGRAGINFVVP